MASWKVPAAVFGAGVAAFLLSICVGHWGPCGPDPLGLTLFLASMLIVPAGFIWLVTALVHTLNARRQSASETGDSHP